MPDRHVTCPCEASHRRSCVAVSTQGKVVSAISPEIRLGKESEVKAGAWEATEGGDSPVTGSPYSKGIFKILRLSDLLLSHPTSVSATLTLLRVSRSHLSGPFLKCPERTEVPLGRSQQLRVPSPMARPGQVGYTRWIKVYGKDM